MSLHGITGQMVLRKNGSSGSRNTLKQSGKSKEKQKKYGRSTRHCSLSMISSFKVDMLRERHMASVGQHYLQPRKGSITLRLPTVLSGHSISAQRWTTNAGSSVRLPEGSSALLQQPRMQPRREMGKNALFRNSLSMYAGPGLIIGMAGMLPGRTTSMPLDSAEENMETGCPRMIGVNP